MELSFEDSFARSPIIAILRNMSPASAVELARNAWDLGVELVEVPIQTPDAVPTLHAVIQAGLERDRPVGAGTVTTTDQLLLVQRLGAAFTVAPGLDAAIVRLSRELAIPHLPGVATATEIQATVTLGCSWVKAFPAASLGPDWFVSMKRGPFPDVSFVATGGVDATNAAAFLRAGAAGVGLGSALSDPVQLEAISEVIRPGVDASPSNRG